MMGRDTNLSARMAAMTPEQWRLVAAYQGAAYRMADHRIKDIPSFASVIEDAALEALCRAAVTWRPDGGRKFYPWLARCFASVVSYAIEVEKGRRAALRVRWELLARGTRRHNGEALPDRPGDVDGGTLADTDMARTRIRLVRGLHRTILHHYFVDGLDYGEVAQAIGYSEGRVRTLAREGMRQIARALARSGDVDPAVAAGI
jgi:DNA-directed RNA polymerase specialized sigma24 family protein